MQNRVPTRISPVVIALCISIAVMLVQTPVMRIGTITAFGSTILVLLCGLFQGKISLYSIKLPSGIGALIAFTFSLVVATVAGTGAFSPLLKVILMLITCIAVSNVNISKREDSVLQWVIMLSAFIYAALTIKSCMAEGANRYMHADIKLFGTSFDPNFIGIPFTAGFVLVLNNILRGKQRLISSLMAITIVVAIVYTASRGTMVSLVSASSLAIWIYLRDRKVAWSAKLFWLFAFFLATLIGVEILSNEFSAGFERMTTLEGSGDSRFGAWHAGFTLWLKSPIWGSGLQGMHKYVGFAAHNTYLQVLAETGLLGFSCMALFVIALIKRAAIEDPIRMCVLLGIFVQILFLDALDNRCVWALLNWAVLNRVGGKYERRIS